MCARLHGWKRHWGHQVRETSQQIGCCSLSVLESDSAIDGVVVRMAAADLPQLDQRESGYARLSIPSEQFETQESIDADIVYLYQSETQNRGSATEQNPILLSYVDCVMAGYQTLFGDTGLDAFMRSTDGWNGVIENDRQAPRYPRAVTLSDETLNHFDQRVVHYRS